MTKQDLITLLCDLHFIFFKHTVVLHLSDLKNYIVLQARVN